MTENWNFKQKQCPWPSKILTLYSPRQLHCSVNVAAIPFSHAYQSKFFASHLTLKKPTKTDGFQVQQRLTGEFMYIVSIYRIMKCLVFYKMAFYCCLFFSWALFPVIAWKPDLMLATEQRDPQVSHCKKNSLVSFCSIVSGDRHVWHVTYSSVKTK